MQGKIGNKNSIRTEEMIRLNRDEHSQKEKKNMAGVKKIPEKSLSTELFPVEKLF